jgi:hypothetical protein
MMALLHQSREFRMHMKNPAQTGSGCIRFNDLNFHQATFAEQSIKNMFNSKLLTFYF